MENPILRPQGVVRQTFAIRPAMLDEINRIAKQYHANRSEVLREIVRRGLPVLRAELAELHGADKVRQEKAADVA